LKKIYSMLGFAQKAGKLSSGTLVVRSSLHSKACLLIMSNDISENTKELLTATSKKRKVPWIVLGNKFELGNSIGKAYRVAVTINDPGIADSIIKLTESQGEGLNSVGVVEWPK
jgi:ribosomal protein L7Ae-like RNA K-turn-binding protein